jgi:hypothetical protein
LRTGYASGDRNTLDGTARAFKFDPGYRVGMILFDDVLDAVSANAADRLADPADKAVPPSGTRSIPTNAAVANAWFVAPAFSCSPLEWLGIDVGGMWAMAPVGLVDAYRTNVLAGGYPTNPWGAAAEGKNLGFEGSGGLRLRLPQLASLRTVLALQGGAFFPGDAFETEDGSTLGTIWKVRALIDVGW